MSAGGTKIVYTTYDLARLLGTSDTSVKRWIKTGRLEAYKTPGGHRRITRPALERFANENNMPLLETVSATKRIVIVDDHKDFRDMFEFLLLKYDPTYDIKQASDGFSAGKMIAQFKPDLVVLDLMMPGIDGFSVCKDIKSSSDTHSIKVLIVTGYASENNIERIKKAGADIVLRKPVDAGTLFKAVEILL
ncbi:response regulator [candidate division KSB1 bacterium]